MTRGQGLQSKVHYKGKENDFIVFVEDPAMVKKWNGDKTVPLTEVVNAFKVFVTGMQGAQGDLNMASNGTLDDEFGTHQVEEVIKTILQRGAVQESESAEKNALRNESIGARNYF